MVKDHKEFSKLPLKVTTYWHKKPVYSVSVQMV